WRVQRVALPLESAVTKLVEDVARRQEERVGRDPGAGDGGVPEDVAEFDHAVLGCDAHERLPSVADAAGTIDDREEQRVAASGRRFQPREELVFDGHRLAKVAEALLGAVRQAGSQQLASVAQWVERFEG